MRVPGNQTPRAEFNIYADPDAAATVFDLTSKTIRPEEKVDIYLAPLDVTSKHTLTQETWEKFSKDLILAGSPLAIFIDGMLSQTFDKMRHLFNAGIFGCHDSLPIHCLLEPEIVEFEHDLDIRVETDGKWTRGETVFDQRPTVIWNDALDAIIRDNGGWFSGPARNSLSILKSSGVPEGDAFGLRLLEGIFLPAHVE